MATETDHIAVANRNQETINYLCTDLGKHAPWIATVAFYKALHVVEAVFANDPSIRHTSDHPTRFQKLKRKPQYQQIYRHYSTLSRISIIARYLEDGSNSVPCFEKFMNATTVSTVVLFHHLKQIETSARTRISQPDSHVSVDTAKSIIK